MAGKSSKFRGNATADTVVSPSPPPYGTEAVPAELDIQQRADPGVHSAERVIPVTVAEGRQGCLVRDEVVEYLGQSGSRELRARVEAHLPECSACRQWVRHIGDEILEYIGGQRSEEELARMDAHLDACDTCRDLVHHVVQGMAQSWHGEGRDGDEPGTTFISGNVVNGRYLILRFVGRGGMGEVYEAFDQLMDRRIALKTVLCTVADRPRAARRFKEEVRNAQRVGHRHVCRINDLQEHREAALGPPLPFFTMEFIDGERLGNRLAAGPLPLDEVRTIALQLLGGLEAAHARGVLHLDFKSDNVMLRRDSPTPDAVIMDFGLSRVLGKESRLRTSDRRQFAGTLPYMSVEQLECRDVLGPATDVYAFGVVLYETLTRALPFDGESLSAVLLRQLKERPKPPSYHVPALSRALDRFVLKCLHNDPRQRYADAGQARAALEALGSWTRPPAARRLRRASFALATGALLVAAFATLGVRPPPANTPAAAAPLAPMDITTSSLEQQTHALRPPSPPSPAPPPPVATEAMPPAAPETPPAAVTPAATRTDRRRASGAARATPTAHEPARAEEPAAASPAEAPAPAAPGASPPGPTSGPSSGSDPAGSNDAIWKPTRVPKRLSVPVAAERDAPER